MADNIHTLRLSLQMLQTYLTGGILAVDDMKHFQCPVDSVMHSVPRTVAMTQNACDCLPAQISFNNSVGRRK